jgi:DNA-binding transcriptional regulator YdaS (Cro superfamily)
MTPEPPVEPLIKLIPLTFIKEDHDTQIRGGVSSARVKELEEILQQTANHLDPIDVCYEGDVEAVNADNPVHLADGWHRIAAYRSAGKTKIPARLNKGGKSEAIEIGLKRNGHHGTPMTSKEKRCAAEVAVNDPRIGEFTDTKIARLIGVSPSLVNQVRRGIKPEPAPKKQAEKPAPESAPSAPPETTATATGKRESESTAPRSATVRERQPEDLRPTKAAVLRRIQEELDTDVIDRDDLLKLLDEPDGSFVFLPKLDSGILLRIVGVSGREQAEIPVTIRELAYDKITVRYTAGKVRAE